MSELVRHYTTHQAAKLMGVRPHVMRALVERGLIRSVVRLHRPEAGELTSYPDRPQDMIDPADLESLREDPEAWKAAVDSVYVRHAPRPKHSAKSPTNEAEGRARRAVDDLMEGRRLARELGDW